jgi:hypothetical protein
VDGHPAFQRHERFQDLHGVAHLKLAL